MRPLGVGINLQPTAVRELTELGLAEELSHAGITIGALTLFNKHGQLICTNNAGCRPATTGRNSHPSWPTATAAVAGGSGRLEKSMSAAVWSSNTSPRTIPAWPRRSWTEIREDCDRRDRCTNRGRWHPLGGSQTALPKRGRATLRRADLVALCDRIGTVSRRQ